ncbi:MAG: 4-phosphoerythronate dehydrogenase [Bacteroidota bacterium]
MKILIDKNVPFIHGVLEAYADIKYVKGSKISRELVAGADAIIIRTRTRCNKQLLEGTGVKFIGTTSIGTDHIDIDWCRANGIHCASAPGCNSGSVMQYLTATLLYLAVKYTIDPPRTTLGIVGVGNVGSKVADMAKALGYKIMLNDPPRERIEGKKFFTSLDKLLYESDIVTLHVPLSLEGPDKTHQMVNDRFLSKMKMNSILINTSRGQVVDEKALIAQIVKTKIKSAVLDVWGNEPGINRNLLELCNIGTAHIAGYSVDGKANATKMIVRQLAKYFDLPLKDWKPGPLPVPDDSVIDISEFGDNDMEIIFQAVKQSYDIEKDSDKLKKNPELFEKLRNDYGLRREFHAYTVKGDKQLILNKLRELGFK